MDVDGLDVLLRHHGHSVRGESDTIILSALPRFAALFEKWGIKGTFFVVGSYLLDPEKVELIRSLAEAGHEIGNHTMNHPFSLSALEAGQQEREIIQAEQVFAERLGIRPVGFRAPNFDVDERVLGTLKKRGYIYDSSVLPMPYGPLLRWCKQRISKTMGVKTRYLGKAVYGLAPLAPYRTSGNAVWRRGSDGLTEVPITTMPFFRLPFHASFSMALKAWGGGDLLFKIGYACASYWRVPLNYVFHACELAEVPLDDRLKKHWGLYLPVEERLTAIDAMLADITRNYEVRPTCQFVCRAEGGRSG
ncbi:MAG: polysaccharide deacetylase family protein [Deltaproteobacteria bacterium]|nr:polysaccharide deacetylase family protein [Deltaproteobacteria bacterium]